jgi:hypothetical protein
MSNRDLKTFDGDYRTGIADLNDARMQPKAKRTALTVSEYEQLPNFTSSPVMDVPIPVSVRYPSPENTTLVRREPPEQYNPPSSKASYMTTTNAVRDQSPDYGPEVDEHVNPQFSIRNRRGG